MAGTDHPFGPRLRELRTARGLTLTAFAGRIFYSKGHVSRVETGKQEATVEFARLCDSALEAGGELSALVPGSTAQAPDAQAAPSPQDEDEVWIMTMSPDGSSSLTPVGRRGLLVGGAVVLAGLAAVPRAPRPRAPVAVEHHERLLAAARAIGQTAPPRTVLPILAGQAQALRDVAHDARGADLRAVAALSSRTAEFAGWMAQEAGDDGLALWWTSRAVRAAAEGGDRHAATYALVRQALITLYQGKAADTVGLAQRAQAAAGTPPRILGLAAQREAQGHALAGDHQACFRALDRARAHLQAAEEPVTPLTIGTSHVPDPVAAVTGWCLYDLGRPAEAAAVLAAQTAAIAPTAVRARLRFGLRQVLATAAAGDLDGACALAAPMLAQAEGVASATIQADVRRLSKTLSRFPTHPAAQALSPALTRLLHPSGL